MKKRAIVIASVASTIDQFCMNDIKLLSVEYEVHVAANFINGNNTSLERIQEFKEKLDKLGIKYFNICFSRKPISFLNLKAYKDIKNILNTYQYNLIHLHTPVASMITRLANKRKKHSKQIVLYTAHGFHFYKGASLLNWLIYYPLEKFLSKQTDVLITINDEDYSIASRKFKSKQILKIPGVGVNIDEFNRENINIEFVKESIGIPKDSFMLLSVGELNKNKNHKVVIEALSKLHQKDIYYVVCGKGNLKNKLIKLANKHNVNDRVRLLGFRQDVSNIYKAANLFIFPSRREGLSLALMEAMASEKAVICSNIRGNSDLIKQELGGYLVGNNSSEYRKRVIELYNNRNLLSDFGKFNSKFVQNFSLNVVSGEMDSIYKGLDKYIENNFS